MRGKPKSLPSNGQPPQPSFEPNSWYEALLKIKHADPKRYEKSISTVTQHCVDHYTERKALVAKSRTFITQ
jgi:hypothetical protein